MPKILITGGAGFIGSHLCDRFVKEGYDVIAMDNLLTGSLDNISHLFPRPNFTFHHHDVTKFIHIPGDLDYILHFASPASPVDYLKMPIQTMKVGSLGTHNCLGLAKDKGARIVVASTSEVYGDPLVHPQTEDYWGNVNPIGPRGVYDEAKRFQEALTMAYHTYHGVNTGIVRIFLTIFGDGSQTRSFCYVDDLVDGIYRLLLSNHHFPVNVGNPQEITINEFAKEILALTGSYKGIEYHPLPTDDPKQRKPDITKAKELLGWEPKISRPLGLTLTYQYFKSKH